MRSLLSTLESLASAKHAGTRKMENSRTKASMPSSKTTSWAADLEPRRQGKQQQLEELLSRPSRRAKVILGAASLLPIDDYDYEKYAAPTPSSASPSSEPSSPPQRRSLLAATLLLPPLSAAASAASLLSPHPAEAAAAANEAGNELYSSPKGFSLLPPRGWLLKSKPGADVLFASPRNPRATIGVTTAPVRLAALSDFGSVAEVADRLLGAELAKDGCLSATLRLSSEGEVPSEWRSGPGPDAPSSSPPSSPSSTSSPSSPPSSLYYFEYELLTTRAHKVVVVAVGVSGRTLFIANGFAPCAKGDGTACPPLSLPPSSPSAEDDDQPSSILAELRRSVSTFSIS